MVPKRKHRPLEVPKGVSVQALDSLDVDHVRLAIARFAALGVPPVRAALQPPPVHIRSAPRNLRLTGGQQLARNRVGLHRDPHLHQLVEFVFGQKRFASVLCGKLREQRLALLCSPIDVRQHNVPLEKRLLLEDRAVSGAPDPERVRFFGWRQHLQNEAFIEQRRPPTVALELAVAYRPVGMVVRVTFGDHNSPPSPKIGQSVGRPALPQPRSPGAPSRST